MSPRPEGDRFALLAAADEVADGTLLLAATAARLLGLVVPAFADVATLDSISPDGELRRLGSRVDAPRGREELEAALLRRRPLPDAPVGLPRAIVSSESQLLASVTDADLHAIASSEEDFELLRALELRSALFIPLRARGRTVGALALGVGTSGRSYDEDDLRFAEVLAGRIALALDNATLSQTVTGLERRLEATLTNLAEAVLVREPGGQIVFANSAAAGLLNLHSAQNVIDATPQQLMDLYDVFDEAGRRLDLADLPSSRAGQGHEAAPLLVRNIIRATGEERWLLHKATPVFDPDGSLSLIVSVIEDLTEVKRAELAQRVLAEAGQELSSSLDYERTLQRVAELTVPRLADWCAVAMRRGDQLPLVALAHVEIGKIARVRDFEARHPPHLTDSTGVAEVVRSGEPLLIPEVNGDVLAGAGLTGEELALARELKLRSVIVVPLAIADQPPIGALSLAMAESGRRLGRPIWRSPPSSGGARRSPSRTHGCTVSSPRSPRRSSGACCRPIFPRSPASGWRACIAPPASTTRSAATSTTCSRYPEAGWWSSATWPGAARRRPRSRRSRATHSAPPASSSEIRSRRSSS